MVECRWAILCDHAVVDRYTNNVSLLHIIDQIRIDPEVELGTSISISLDLMTLFERSDLTVPEKGATRLVLILPDDGEESIIETPVDLENHERLRHRLQLQGIPFRGFGRYRFRIDLQEGDDWVTAGMVYLKIIQAEVKQTDSQ